MTSSKIVALDFETELTDGTPSVEFYRNDFRAKSMALTFTDGRCGFYLGENSIRGALQRLQAGKYSVVTHNLQFEYGVTRERFPELVDRIDWSADTQRMVQLGDNGANGLGVSLEASALRWLPTEFHHHKKPYHDLIASRGGSGGQDLHLLTPPELRAYNIADTRVTLELYNTLTAYFKEISYDTSLDFVLYKSACKLSAKSKSKGVYVDRSQVESSRSTISASFDESRGKFYAQHSAGIQAINERLRVSALAEYKTARGAANADLSGATFNIDSTAHLKMLFCDHYGVQPQFFTPKGKPSMSAKFFAQWGSHAQHLQSRGNQEITLNQLAALEENSRYDSRLHIDVRINGTKTGRGASGDEI